MAQILAHLAGSNSQVALLSASEALARIYRGGSVGLSDKTLNFIYFAFCDSQSRAVTVTPTVLYSPTIYLSPSIIILALAYVWCTFDILVLGFVTPCVF